MTLYKQQTFQEQLIKAPCEFLAFVRAVDRDQKNLIFIIVQIAWDKLEGSGQSSYKGNQEPWQLPREGNISALRLGEETYEQ